MSKTRSIAFTAVVSLAGAAAAVACSSRSAEPVASALPTPAAARAAAAGGLTVPSWATPDRLVGRIDAAEPITVQVHLRLRDEVAAEAELRAVSAPDSAKYGQFLTTEAFDAKYAPTEAEVAALRAHLEASGLTVTHVPSNRAYVAAEGRAADVERAFATRLGTFRTAAGPKRAPMDLPSLPAAFASRVLGVMGLTTPRELAPRNVITGGIPRSAVDPDDTTTTGTCSEWWGSTPDVGDPPYGNYGPLALAPCGYRPGQLRAAYGFNDVVRKGNDGTGEKIAIVDAYFSPTLLADAQTYAAHNDPDYPLATTQFEGHWGPGTPPTKQSSGWFGEQTLDVEAVHAMAPGAHIVYVGAINAGDQALVGAINMIIAGKMATIVSNSYGSIEWSSDGPTDFAIWHSLATQAGLKGVGLYFSSGDDGDETINNGPENPSADFPASLDNATAVGGTSLAMDRTGNRLWEVGWETAYSRLLAPPVDAGADASSQPTGLFNDAGAPLSWQPAAPGAFRFGAGGGVSMVYEQPAWQKGIVPDSVALVEGFANRAVPDVGMLADPVTGFLIGQTSSRTNVYSESPIGGTSLACPLFSATMALAQQKAKRHFGFANPLLYKASKKAAFRDVVPPTSPTAVAVRAGVVATFDYAGQTIHTAPGWDTVTGLGSPNGESFLKALK
jgi:subtilase family serine protease